ncbi:hypothetical protein Tco_1176569 [Tanacetum coccineum]
MENANLSSPPESPTSPSSRSEASFLEGESGFELLIDELESKETVKEFDDEIVEELEEEEEENYLKYLNMFPTKKRPSSSTGRHLTQEEAVKEALALRISQKFALLEEVRPVLKTMAYNDKYKKVLDEIWKDKVELDGMIAEEEEKAIIKVKGKALKEKDDPKVFIFPIRFEGKINKNALADTGSDINTMSYRIYEKLGREEIKRSDVLRTAKSDSDGEEEYEIKRNKFGAPMYGSKPAAYLNCNDPAE